MEKRQEILDISESWPQFCNVYVPHQSSHRLGIPPDFVKHFAGVLPYKSTITTQEKRLWHVELKQLDEHLFFQEGWKQFVHDNSLEFGDFLIFYYGGNAQFYIKLYGKNGCRKKVGKEITHPQDNQTVERRNSKQLVQGAKGEESPQKELCPILSLGIQVGNKTRKEASKVVSEFVSEFPSFEVIVRPSYLTRGTVNIPSSFRKRFMEKDRHGVTLVASDRSWFVKLDKYKRKFCHGWSTFCRENKLKEGDVCVFELIEKNDFILKVSIFRCSD